MNPIDKAGYILKGTAFVSSMLLIFGSLVYFNFVGDSGKYLIAFVLILNVLTYALGDYLTENGWFE